MINRSKHRFIAFVLFTIAFFLFALSFIESHIEHNKNNWYVTVEEGDIAKTFILLPNIPYYVDSDDNISYLSFALIDEHGVPVTALHLKYADTDLLGESNGPLCIHHFNITCKDTTYLTIGVYLSGWFTRDAYYEVHKDVKEGRDLYFNGIDLSRDRKF
ncbi:hypothetical protein MASR2M39_29990 [Ignavibacteriales bacterium]